MAAPARIGDDAHAPSDAHACPACPHEVTGPAVEGSPDTTINDRPVLRVGDHGRHGDCCGANVWTAAEGAPTVWVNDRPLARVGDRVHHCGGAGQIVAGSPDVEVGSVGAEAAAPFASSAPEMA
jgi:uncharacterized Zn-binding protein involved in type VI secretion